MDFKLCDLRKEILNQNSHILVTGGPGSGKTTIALKKAQLKIENELSPNQNVLFLSFSRAAVSRIIESSSKWLPKDVLKQIEIQTFHSFFWRILRTYGYLISSCRKLSILFPHEEKTKTKGAKEGSKEWAIWLKEKKELFEKQGIITFDDFSQKTLDLLKKSNTICKVLSDKFPLIIVDEAQDTDEEQWACICELAKNCQIFCLADLEQQIYDFRKGVSSERVNDILNYLSPYRADLGSENNRSPDNEILRFGNDILLAKPKDKPYNGVSRLQFRSDRINRDNAIRQVLGRFYKTYNDAFGEYPKSVALLTCRGKGVTIISNALRGDENRKPIPHKILFDETEALLASELVAFLLEPKRAGQILSAFAVSLELLSKIYYARGTTTSIKQADTLISKAKEASIRIPRFTKLTSAIYDVVKEVAEKYPFCGDPRKDWMKVRHLLQSTKESELLRIDQSVEYLMAFNRGKAISAGLSGAWQNHGAYKDARQIVSSSLNVEQLHSDVNDDRGVHVMTLHKSKGKEFDGVILYDDSRISPFINWGDKPPYTKSRKLLRVGVTRAKKLIFLLTDVYTPTELLAGFRFE